MFVTDKYIYDSLEKKVIDISQKVIKVGQRLGSVKEFFKFDEKFHTTLGCDKPDCDIKCFIDALWVVVVDPNKDYDYRRNVFIPQSVLPPTIFSSLHRVQLEGEECLKNLLLRLNKD